MKYEELTPELQEELKREARKQCAITKFMLFNSDYFIAFVDGALSETAKRIHTAGMMPCEWISVDTPPRKENESDNSSGNILVLGVGGYVGIGCYYFGSKKFSHSYTVGWMPLPDPSGTPQGYISIEEIRTAISDYIASEGCSCCQDKDSHDEAMQRIGTLLKMEPYSDGSGFDYGIYKSQQTK